MPPNDTTVNGSSSLTTVEITTLSESRKTSESSTTISTIESSGTESEPGTTFALVTSDTESEQGTTSASVTSDTESEPGTTSDLVTSETGSEPGSTFGLVTSTGFQSSETSASNRDTAPIASTSAIVETSSSLSYVMTTENSSESMNTNENTASSSDSYPSDSSPSNSPPSVGETNSYVSISISTSEPGNTVSYYDQSDITNSFSSTPTGSPLASNSGSSSIATWSNMYTSEIDTTKANSVPPAAASTSALVIVLSSLLAVFVLLFVLLLVYVIWKTCRRRRNLNYADEATFLYTGQSPARRQGQVLEMIGTGQTFAGIKDSVPRLSESDVYVSTTTLAFGRFGPLYKGYVGATVATMTEVVFKTLKANASREDRSGFAEQLEIYSSIDSHINILRLNGVLVTSASAPAAFEFCMYGSLWAVLRQIKNGDERFLDIDNRLGRLELVLGIASGMRHLSSRGIVHRELTANEVLVANDFVPKITGLNGKASNVFIRWSAPEVLSNRKYTFMSDVWSFGVVMWEIYSLGEKPYDEMPSADLLAKLITGHRLSKPDICEKAVYDLMNQCWGSNPYDRPTFLVAVDKIRDVIRAEPDKAIVVDKSIAAASERL